MGLGKHRLRVLHPVCLIQINLHTQYKIYIYCWVNYLISGTVEMCPLLCYNPVTDVNGVSDEMPILYPGCIVTTYFANKPESAYH